MGIAPGAALLGQAWHLRGTEAPRNRACVDAIPARFYMRLLLLELIAQMNAASYRECKYLIIPAVPARGRRIY